MKYARIGILAKWSFYEVTDHGFPQWEGKPLYGFTTDEPVHAGPSISPELGELYASIEHAMVAAVGEKYTGPRGASGTGVNTAAGWFMRMIGADTLVPAGSAGVEALAEALHGADGFPPVEPRGFARRVADRLARRDITLARLAGSPFREMRG